MGYTPNSVFDRIFMAVAADLPDYDSPSGKLVIDQQIAFFVSRSLCLPSGHTSQTDLT